MDMEVRAKNHSDELIFYSQGLRRSAANLADRIGEITFANFTLRVFAQSASTWR